MHPKIQRSSKFINWVYHASLSDVALWAILALVVVAIVLNSVASYHQRKHTLEIELQGNYESSLLAASMFTSRIQDIWLLEEAASTTLVTLNQQQAQAYLEHLLISQSLWLVALSPHLAYSPHNEYRCHTNRCLRHHSLIQRTQRLSTDGTSKSD